VALLRTDVSEELSTSFIRVIRIGELGTTLAVTINRRTLRKEILGTILGIVMCSRVDPVRTDVTEERIASILRVEIINELITR
jgi:hypothetical protein